MHMAVSGLRNWRRLLRPRRSLFPLCIRTMRSGAWCRSRKQEGSLNRKTRGHCFMWMRYRDTGSAVSTRKNQVSICCPWVDTRYMDRRVSGSSMSVIRQRSSRSYLEEGSRAACVPVRRMWQELPVSERR